MNRLGMLCASLLTLSACASVPPPQTAAAAPPPSKADLGMVEIQFRRTGGSQPLQASVVRPIGPQALSDTNACVAWARRSPRALWIWRANVTYRPPFRSPTTADAPSSI